MLFFHFFLIFFSFFLIFSRFFDPPKPPKTQKNTKKHEKWRFFAFFCVFYENRPIETRAFLKYPFFGPLKNARVYLGKFRVFSHFLRFFCVFLASYANPSILSVFFRIFSHFFAKKRKKSQKIVIFSVFLRFWAILGLKMAYFFAAGYTRPTFLTFFTCFVH